MELEFLISPGWEHAVHQYRTNPPRIAMLLGKPPRSDSVLSEVVERLRASADIVVHVATGEASLPESLDGSALILQRGLGVPELTAVLRLEALGMRCCNRIAATLATWDRAGMLRTLSVAGVPVPATAVLATWPEVTALAARQPLVVKAADGSVGRGQGVYVAARDDLPPQAPFAGPYLGQEYIAGGDRIHKVYVIGGRQFGLIKRWRRAPHDRSGEPYVVDGPLATVSRLVGSALDLDIYGVDFLFGPQGPVVIDVNPFPSCEGIPGAAETIGAFLLHVAASSSPSCR